MKNISKHPHPQQLVFSNVVGRLKLLIKQTIRIYEEDLSLKKPTNNTEKTLYGLFEHLSIDNTLVQVPDEADDSRWIKKITLDSINSFKEEIENYPQ